MLELEKTIRWFFYSEDLGLLENQISEFKKNFSNVDVIKNSTIENINSVFLQQNIFFSNNPTIFENFSGNIEALIEHLLGLDYEKFNFLITFQSNKEIKLKTNAKKLFNNDNFRLIKLNNLTKKKYIMNVLDFENISIEKKYLDVALMRLPPSAKEINDFVYFVNLLKKSKKLDDRSFNYLLDVCHLNSNEGYKFFELFFCEGIEKWMKVLNQLTNHNQDTLIFIKIFINRICDFFSFLDMRKKMNFEEIKAKYISSPYTLKTYQKIYDKNGSDIYNFMSKFILDFVIFVEKKIFLPNNILEMKYFFLSNCINDYK